MYFEILGSKKTHAPSVVLSSGLGGSAHFWQPQLAALAADHRIILYDHNGTGRSPDALPSDYSIELMTQELLALLDSIGVDQCHFVGHALGGLVGLQIALLQAARLQSLLLVNAWSSPNPHTQRCFTVRKAILDKCSPQIYLQTQALLLYPPDWIVNNIKQLESEERHGLEHFPDKANLLARIGALSQFDIDPQLGSIDVNTLVVANKDDMLVPWQRSKQLAEQMPKARLSLLDYGGHACTVTVAEQFNALLLRHLSQCTAD